MNYCTKQDLIDRFGENELVQLTDRIGTGLIDDAVINQAIADAAAEIDNYIVKYLPLSAVPAGLVRIACDIARFYLYDDAVIDIVEKRYDGARHFLEMVAKGQASLGVDISGNIPAENNVVLMQSDGSDFSRYKIY